MEYSSAEMTCILKINTQCEGCKVKVMQVLRNIRGVYNVTIDGEQGTVKVTGRVNPRTLLSVLEKYGKHAEVKYIKFDGEVMEQRSPYYGEYCGYAPPPYGTMESSLVYPQHQCYQACVPPPPLPLPWPPLPPPPRNPPLVPLPSFPPGPLPPIWPPQTRPYGPPPLAPEWPPPPRPPPPRNPAPKGEPSGGNKQNECTVM